MPGAKLCFGPAFKIGLQFHRVRSVRRIVEMDNLEGHRFLIEVLVHQEHTKSYVDKLRLRGRATQRNENQKGSEKVSHGVPHFPEIARIVPLLAARVKRQNRTSQWQETTSGLPCHASAGKHCKFAARRTRPCFTVSALHSCL